MFTRVKLLGGIKSGDITTTEALNSCKNNGKYYVSNGITGAAYNTGHTLLVIKVSDYVTQIAIDVATLKVSGRSLLDRTGQTWDSWVRLDNFGCSTVSELASLLGVRITSWVVDASPARDFTINVTAGKLILFTRDYGGQIEMLTIKSYDNSVVSHISEISSLGLSFTYSNGTLTVSHGSIASGSYAGECIIIG